MTILLADWFAETPDILSNVQFHNSPSIVCRRSIIVFEFEVRNRRLQPRGRAWILWSRLASESVAHEFKCWENWVNGKERKSSRTIQHVYGNNKSTSAMRVRHGRTCELYIKNKWERWNGQVPGTSSNMTLSSFVKENVGCWHTRWT